MMEFTCWPRATVSFAKYSYLHSLAVSPPVVRLGGSAILRFVCCVFPVGALRVWQIRNGTTRPIIVNNQLG